MAICLSQICAFQKQYSKTDEELRTMVEGFCWVLSGIPMPQILDAIKVYVSTNNDIPAPADILAIIRPPQQELSAAMYVKIMKDCTVGGKLLYGDRKAFVEAFERQEMSKMRGGSELLRECKREVETAQLEYQQPEDIDCH